MKLVVAINGKPRAGKDTCVQLMASHLASLNIASRAYSSIEPVKSMLRDYVDLRGKTEADRKLLAVVGNALQEHSAFRTGNVLFTIEDFFNSERVGVFFLHMREPDLIEVVKRKVELRGIRFIRLYVESNRSENITSNEADAGVEGGEYEVTIVNNGTMQELSRACVEFLSNHLLAAPV